MSQREVQGEIVTDAEYTANPPFFEASNGAALGAFNQQRPISLLSIVPLFPSGVPLWNYYQSEPPKNDGQKGFDSGPD